MKDFRIDDFQNCYIEHFFAKVRQDKNLHSSHISLYMAIIRVWMEQRSGDQIVVSRQQLMELSKIGSRATYHRCITYLCKIDVIKYYPTYDSYVGTKIKLLAL